MAQIQCSKKFSEGFKFHESIINKCKSYKFLHFCVSFFIKMLHLWKFPSIQWNNEELSETLRNCFCIIISYWGRVGRGSCHNSCVITCSQPPLFCVCLITCGHDVVTGLSPASFISTVLCYSLPSSLFFFPFIELFSFKFWHFLQHSFLKPSILWIIKVCVWWKWLCFAVAFFVGTLQKLIRIYHLILIDMWL